MTSLLIIGKTGQVATALGDYTKAHNITADFVGRDQCDLAHLTSPDPITELIAKSGAKAVLNAAAYTAVDLAEDESDIAHAVNEQAPAMMAAACKKANIPLIHVSTDYVFDGTAKTPYRENDKTGPTSIYGKSKLAGENAIIAASCDYAILRTAWVFSATGKNFVKTMLYYGAERDQMTIVADQHGCPTPAGAISKAMVEIASALIADPSKSGTYHFAGDTQTTWADFARAIFATANLTTEVIDITTDQFPKPAKRPAWSVLDTTKIKDTFGINAPDWRIALTDIIHTLKQGA